MLYSLNDKEKFTLAINYQAFQKETPEEKTQTIIHEIGHLINDRNSQRFPGVKDAHECKGENIFDVGFCYKKDSIYGKFYRLYCGPKRSKDIKDYVSEYAMKRCNEDFAETFSHYILETDFRDKEGGLVQAKINFMRLNQDVGDGLNLEDLKKEFRRLISTSQYCNEMSGK
jgi:hypothetical protein